jgi:hypothetical protein
MCGALVASMVLETGVISPVLAKPADIVPMANGRARVDGLPTAVHGQSGLKWDRPSSKRARTSMLVIPLPYHSAAAAEPPASR